jgi:hypothetical protein
MKAVESASDDPPETIPSSSTRAIAPGQMRLSVLPAWRVSALKA